MAKGIDLSIIILNYNTWELLGDCLRSISKTKKGRYMIETIVVDNASQDKSPEMVEKEFGWVKLIRSKTNLGFAAGNNLAVPHALGRYLLFLNSDTVLPDQIFPEIIDFLDRNKKVGALTVRLVLRSGEMDPDCHRGFPTPWASLTYFVGMEKLFPQSRLFGRYHQFYLPQDEIHEIDCGCGAFLMVRKEVIQQVGSWDEDYFFYGEDIDFCFRIKKGNWQIVYYPQAEVIHYKGASSGLRTETSDITKADRPTRLKAAKASSEAMKIFYNKFYRKQYPRILTSIIIFGIQVKGWFRFLLNYFKS